MAPETPLSLFEGRTLAVTLHTSSNKDAISDQSGSVIGTSAARKHNAVLPIHSLPPEIFFICLYLSIDFTSLNRLLVPQLRTLARVSASWLFFIRSESRFWCLLNLHEVEWAETMVRKNPRGTLAARAVGSHTEGDLNALLQVIHKHARRLKTLTWHVETDPETAKMFDFHAPLLEHLDILSHARYSSGPYHGNPMAEICTVYFPWDSPSFSGLKFLNISHFSTLLPSLTQLTTILQASPGLQWFGLSHLYMSHLEDIEDDIPSDRARPILLSALRGLMLNESLQCPLVQYLAGALVVPNCNLIRVHIKFSELLRSGSNIFELCTAVMRGEGSNIQVGHFYPRNVRRPRSLATIGSQDPRDEERLTDWASDAGHSGGMIDVREMPYTVESWRFLVEALGPMMQRGGHPMSLELQYGPSTFSGQDISTWNFASSIHFDDCYPYLIPALNYLSAPTTTPDEFAQWPCPQLTSVMFLPSGFEDEWMQESLVDVIVEFATNRAMAVADGAGSDLESGPPVALEVISGPEVIIGELRGKVPGSIRLRVCEELQTPLESVRTPVEYR